MGSDSPAWKLQQENESEPKAAKSALQVWSPQVTLQSYMWLNQQWYPSCSAGIFHTSMHTVAHNFFKPFLIFWDELCMESSSIGFAVKQAWARVPSAPTRWVVSTSLYCSFLICEMKRIPASPVCLEESDPYRESSKEPTFIVSEQ